MSGRRGRSGAGRSAPRPLASARPVESWPDGDWVVQQVTGASSVKEYRCPGCQQAIAPGTPHVVAWPHDDGTRPGASTVGARRHWHTSCWRARDRRR
jgi:hypothetical protein